MKEIEEKYKVQLLADYVRVTKILEDCLIGGEKVNFQIAKEDYITPTIASIKLPLDNPHGKYIYYSNIRNALELALTTGSLPTSQRLPYKSPSYLTDLVEISFARDLSDGYEPGNLS